MEVGGERQAESEREEAKNIEKDIFPRVDTDVAREAVLRDCVVHMEWLRRSRRGYVRVRRAENESYDLCKNSEEELSLQSNSLL